MNLYDIDFRRYGIFVLVTTAEKIEALKSTIQSCIRNLIVVCPCDEDDVVTHNDWAVQYFTSPLKKEAYQSDGKG